VLALDLRDGLTGAELAELRWHVGQGPRPEAFAIVTDHFMVEVDGRLEVDPAPLLAGSGEAYRIGGTLHSSLAPRDGAAGWRLDLRQELHAEELESLRVLLDRLAGYADGGGGPVGHLRFYEDDRPAPLVLRDGVIAWADPVR
jgi:hypothetical protein